MAKFVRTVVSRSRSLSLEQIVAVSREVMLSRHFTPHPLLKNRHVMTIAGNIIRRNFPSLTAINHERTFQVDSESKILAHCGWQPEPKRAPTMIVVHGLEGSSLSKYAIGTAMKGYRAGFNVVRLNQRGCGNTMHLSPTPYHAGLCADIRAVIDELVLDDGLSDFYICGFSLGGNQSLKLAGEYGANPPAAIRAVCAVSTPIDLSLSSDALHWPENRLYEMKFLLSLHQSYRKRQRLYPSRYAPLSRFHLSLREFDDLIAGPSNGFRNAAEYYSYSNSKQYLNRIHIPTLLIQAEDDPFIPFEQYQSSTMSDCCILLATKYGGHVGFVTRHSQLEDSFWAENRVVEFFRTVYKLSRLP